MKAGIRLALVLAVAVIAGVVMALRPWSDNGVAGADGDQDADNAGGVVVAASRIELACPEFLAPAMREIASGYGEAVAVTDDRDQASLIVDVIEKESVSPLAPRPSVLVFPGKLRALVRSSSAAGGGLHNHLEAGGRIVVERGAEGAFAKLVEMLAPQEHGGVVEYDSMDGIRRRLLAGLADVGICWERAELAPDLHELHDSMLMGLQFEVVVKMAGPVAQTAEFLQFLLAEDGGMSRLRNHGFLVPPGLAGERLRQVSVTAPGIMRPLIEARHARLSRWFVDGCNFVWEGEGDIEEPSLARLALNKASPPSGWHQEPLLFSPLAGVTRLDRRSFSRGRVLAKHEVRIAIVGRASEKQRAAVRLVVKIGRVDGEGRGRGVTFLDEVPAAFAALEAGTVDAVVGNKALLLTAPLPAGCRLLDLHSGSPVDRIFLQTSLPDASQSLLGVLSHCLLDPRADLAQFGFSSP